MAIILNIETTTKNCSVCVSNDGEVLQLTELDEANFSHAEKLHSFILEVLKNADLSLKDIDAVAVSKGPGSYTGLRIGVSSAKGLCFALDVPLISISTLGSLARSINVKSDELIIPLLDARRMEVYSAVFDSNYSQIRETMAEIIEETSFENILQNNKVHFLGDGSSKCRSVIQSENAIFHEIQFPSAREMAMQSYDKYINKEFEDLAYFEPYYLKDFIAGKPKNKLL